MWATLNDDGFATFYGKHRIIYTYITCTNGDKMGLGVVSLDESKKLGQFCSDSCMVSVMLLAEVREYNSEFDKKLGKNCYTIIQDFEGEIELFEMKAENGIVQRLSFVGKGNVNFKTGFLDE